MRISTERYLGNLASAVRALTRAGAGWAETVALAWRLAAEVDHANIAEGNQISGSQRLQAWDDVWPLSAAAGAPGGGWTRS
jgi:hypothetical protein